MRGRPLNLAVLSLACFAPLARAASARAASGDSKNGYSAWVVPWDTVDAAADGCFEELNPFAFALSSAPALTLASPELLSDTARVRRKGVLLVPVVVNDMIVDGKATELKSERALTVLLTDPARAARHVEELAAAAREFDGLEIDYERIPPGLWSAYGDFIASLGAALRKNGKRLYIDVEPKLLRNKDWAKIASAVDRIKVMAYYERGGAAARPAAGNSTEWVVATARQALKLVPPEKLVVALSLAGTDWAADSPSSWTAKRLNYGQVQDLLSKSRPVVARDAFSAPSFRAVRDGKEHAVWFEDEKSLAEKISGLHGIGVKNIAFWYWGRKHPDAAALDLCRP